MLGLAVTMPTEIYLRIYVNDLTREYSYEF